MTRRTQGPPRWRHRGAERGAVMIEGVLVVFVVTLAFAGGVFFHAMYAAKMKANRDARLDVWTRALNGCHSKIDAGNSLFKTNGDAPISDVNTDSPPLFFEVGHVDTKITSAPVSAPALLEPAGQFTFSSTQQIACNDRLQGEQDDIFGKIGDALGTIIGRAL